LKLLFHYCFYSKIFELIHEYAGNKFVIFSNIEKICCWQLTKKVSGLAIYGLGKNTECLLCLFSEAFRKESAKVLAKVVGLAKVKKSGLDVSKLTKKVSRSHLKWTIHPHFVGTI
jgi:hypothetical protein